MAALLGAQILYNNMTGQPLPIWGSLVAGLAGALLINIFGTETVAPTPVPSKSQQRKAAARTRRSTDDDADDDEQAAPAAQVRARRNRRRKRR
jgi:hypothetical protein